MSTADKAAKLATNFFQIKQALRLNEPVGPDHPFFVDFGGMRGEFEEKTIYRGLNVQYGEDQQYLLDPDSVGSSTLIFLGGMRGTGKTSELLHYQKKLHRPEAYYVVYCGLDEDLNMQDLEYTDILLLQLNKLAAALQSDQIDIDERALRSLNNWFTERVREIEKSRGYEDNFEAGVEMNTGGLLAPLLSIFGKFTTSVKMGSEDTTTIRQVFRRNFVDFKNRFNEFVVEAARAIRNKKMGRDILFIVDGLEKSNTPEIRRKVVIDESSKIREIRANTLFILPIELMQERQKLRQLTEVVTSFPNLKVVASDGKDNGPVLQRLIEMVYRRISPALFDNNEEDRLVCQVARYSGGNPRELLRILEYAYLNADDALGKIDQKALEKGLQKLANETARYLTSEELALLKKLYDNNKAGLQTEYNAIMDKLIEEVTVYEYNDGTQQRANPVLELAKIYRQHVHGEA